ncbi:MAG: hypothetical protein V7739_10260 [Motiliproteus sp.]
MKNLITIFTSLFVCLCLTQAQAAKPEWAGVKKDHKQEIEKQFSEKQSGKDEEKKEKNNKPQLFSKDERSLINDYYNDESASGSGKNKGKKKALPKGLQKKLERGGELPPGWQKKLQRGEVIDPQLRASSESLPEDLLSRLPGDQQVTEILKVKDKIVRVIKGEGTVVDIIDLADVMMGSGRDR